MVVKWQKGMVTAAAVTRALELLRSKPPAPDRDQLEQKAGTKKALLTDK